MTAIVAPMTDMQGSSTGDRRDALGDQAVARYDVLGVGVELDSDDPTVVEVVEASYGIFRPAGDPADRPVPAARIQVRQTASEWLVSGGTAEPRTCRSADMAAVETLDRLVDTVQRGLHARGLISIHSAAVATAHGILVVAGASGQGKSTLALGLAHRGYGLLSDELSIVDGDGTVLPYPRSVHVRPDTIGLIPALGFLADRPRLTLGGGSEWALTPAELRERWDGMAPQAGPLAAILLLEGVPGAADPTVSTDLAGHRRARTDAQQLGRVGRLRGHARAARRRRLPRPVRATAQRPTRADPRRRHRLAGRRRPRTGDAPMIEAASTMDPRDLARLAMLETWRRDGAEAWIEATGGSMLPLIHPGDRLLVGFGAHPAVQGDVILFRHGGLVVAHRVVGVRSRDGVRRIDRQGRQRAVRDRGRRPVRPPRHRPGDRPRDRLALGPRPRWALGTPDRTALAPRRLADAGPGPAHIHQLHPVRGGRPRGPRRALPLDLIPRHVEGGRISRERR